MARDQKGKGGAGRKAGSNESPVVSVRGLKKSYVNNDARLDIFAGLESDIERRSFVSSAGPSGCGKSTLLKIIAGREAYERCSEYLERVGLRGCENYYPNQLSGGMQQRVVIARATDL